MDNALGTSLLNNQTTLERFLDFLFAMYGDR